MSWKHKNKAGDGPRSKMSQKPFVSVSLFLVFCIMHGSLVQMRDTVSFQLLPFPCRGGSRDSELSIMNSIILSMASLMKTGSRIKELISLNSTN